MAKKRRAIDVGGLETVGVLKVCAAQLRLAADGVGELTKTLGDVIEAMGEIADVLDEIKQKEGEVDAG